MNKRRLRRITSLSFSLALSSLIITLVDAAASAQCNAVINGLRAPLGTTLTNQGNLLVSETGNVTPNSGRISIVDASGNRRTLLDSLPAAINDVNETSGPAGLFMRGRVLYLAMGVGDVGRPGPVPGTTIPNPAGASSPIYSSILAIQFSANTEKTTDGFVLSLADQQTLASGQTLTLSDGVGNRMMIKLIANFTDYVPFPLPFFGGNVQLSNPFGVVAIEDELYVTDGGRNRVWQVDLVTGTVSTLVSFPPIPNPLFGIVPAGGPMLDAVPTGIAVDGDQLLVTLFRGVPFPPGTSTVQSIDPATATSTPFITGLKSAIDVLPVIESGQTHYLVLQHASAGPFFGSPGQVKRFDTPAGPPTVLAACLTRPTSMSFDRKSNTLYVSEYGGRVVAIAL
jgi:hypothetical protein